MHTRVAMLNHMAVTKFVDFLIFLPKIGKKMPDKLSEVTKPVTRNFEPIVGC